MTDAKQNIIERLKTSNVLESPKDPKDYSLVACAPKVQYFPDDFIQTYPDNYLNQGNVSSCVIHACSKVIFGYFQKSVKKGIF